MRVLVIHNFYRSENASGENLSVRDEIAGLRSLGWDVEVLSADSDAIGQDRTGLVRVAARPIYSGRSARRTREAIERFRPNVALVENLFPLHSPWVIRVLRQAGVPVAAGVRSYRMWCAASTMFRDGDHCRDCIGTIANLPAIRHGCYQGSSARTVPLAVGLAVHRPTWRMIDAFLAVSDHVRDELVAVGLPAERVVVRPNFVDDPGVETDPGAGDGFLFAGRLTEDKGVGVLLDGWKRSGAWRHARLRIAGSGPLDTLVDGQPAELRVEPLGLVEHSALMEIVASSAVTVVPSLWPEPFGRGVIEAAARSRPALVARAGGLPSLVEDERTGWICEPTADGMAAGLRAASDPDAQLVAGREARRRYLERYTRDVSLGILDRTLRALAEQGAG